MGLAEPRRRIKIAHDPRNIAWTSAQDSYGQRLMQQQGWKAGEALGAKGQGSRYDETEASKVRVQIKDDTLGLGASLKSKDLVHQRTGFDAFQGLLGRLNAKSEEEVKAIEEKIENKKLATYAQGRWGGMVFVPGGILVQNDAFKLKLALDEEKEKKKAEEASRQERTEQSTPPIDLDEVAQKAKRRAEKKLLKEEKRARKEAKRATKSDESHKKDMGLPTPESSSSNEAEGSRSSKKKRARSLETDSEPVTTTAVAAKHTPSNGRHILRGKNILAKRAAFADIKGLDEIFMRKV